MHQNLIESISDENGGMLSMPVLHATTRLLMPRFLLSYFFLCAMLIIYIGGGFYISVNLADFYILTKYEELESILKILRIMLQIMVSIVQTIYKVMILHLFILFCKDYYLLQFFGLKYKEPSRKRKICSWEGDNSC